MTVEFTDACENYSFGGHVQSNGKCLRGKEDLQQTFLEKDLNDFLENG